MKRDYEALVMRQIKDKRGAHYCKDWDYLAIHDEDIEADSCFCFEFSWRFRRELWLATWGIVKAAGFEVAFRNERDLGTICNAAPILLNKRFFWLASKEDLVIRLETKGWEVKLIETYQEK